MQENTSQFLSEVMKQYGLFGVIVIIILLTTLIVIYKFGPQIYDTWRAKASDDHHKRMMHGIKKGPLVQEKLLKSVVSR